MRVQSDLGVRGTKSLQGLWQSRGYSIIWVPAKKPCQSSPARGIILCGYSPSCKWFLGNFLLFLKLAAITALISVADGFSKKISILIPDQTKQNWEGGSAALPPLPVPEKPKIKVTGFEVLQCFLLPLLLLPFI